MIIAENLENNFMKFCEFLLLLLLLLILALAAQWAICRTVRDYKE